MIVSLVALVLVSSATAQQRYTAGEIIIAPSDGAALKQMITDRDLTWVDEDIVSGALLVQVPAGSEQQWIDRLSSLGEVAYAERNGIGAGGGQAKFPNDTSFQNQWHHHNTGQVGGTPGADIDSPEAWGMTTGSSDIVVAVLDTGIDTDHPEFAGRIDPDGFDFVNNDSDPEADHPHGTQVSGALGANGNNSFVVAGVDWNCRILPVKVLNSNNMGSTFDLAQGLNYCATQTDVRIISMSLIGFPPSPTLIDALQTARSAGKILIACAGNDGIGDADTSWPGASPDTISIGATTNTDARAGFSGTGAALDFVAPGTDILTAAHGSVLDIPSSANGCSLATPIAAGIASLMLDLADQFGMTLSQSDVYDLLQAGAEDEVGPPGEDAPGRDDFFGHGRLNAAASLTQLRKIAMAPPNDQCGEPIDAILGDTPFDTANALTNGPAEPGCGFAGSDQIFRDVWFRFIPSSSDEYIISTCDTTIDTRISVYFISCSSSDDTAIACNDDACAMGGSQVTVPMTAAFTYWIRVGAATDETGTGVLNIAVGDAPCPADIADPAGVVDVFDLLELLGQWGQCS